MYAERAFCIDVTSQDKKIRKSLSLAKGCVIIVSDFVDACSE